MRLYDIFVVCFEGPLLTACLAKREDLFSEVSLSFVCPRVRIRGSGVQLSKLDFIKIRIIIPILIVSSLTKMSFVDPAQKHHL